MRKNSNKSFFHYSVEELDNNGNIIDRKLYMTMKDLTDKFKKSRFTFNLVLNDKARRIKSLPNFVFTRVHIAV